MLRQPSWRLDSDNGRKQWTSLGTKSRNYWVMVLGSLRRCAYTTTQNCVHVSSEILTNVSHFCICRSLLDLLRCGVGSDVFLSLGALPPGRAWGSLVAVLCIPREYSRLVRARSARG